MQRAYGGGLAALVALAVGIGCAPTISSNASSGGAGSGCIPGTQVACACPGGTMGIQDCNMAGTSFGACQCSAAASSSSTTTTTSSTSSTGSFSGSGGACTGHINYAGMYSPAPANFAELPNAGGLVSLTAGDVQCKALGIGADHMCDMPEIQAAAAANEPLFAAIPAGTTAWLQRTIPVYVEGLSGTPCTAAMVGQMDAEGDVCVLSPPGPGGNCDVWQYQGHAQADGEYIVFDTAGVPTYHFDNDTVYDPTMPLVHVHSGSDFSCIDERAILCCYACM